MKPSLEELKKAKEVYQTELQKLHNLITHQETIPKIKKLVGKYFKYKNSYSTSERWWMYVHIKEVTPDLDLVVDIVQADTRGKIEFMFDKLDAVYIYENSSYVEITKREYIKSKKLVMNQMNKHFKEECR